YTLLGGDQIVWDKVTEDATGRVDTDGIEEAVKRYQARWGLSDNSEELARWVQDADLGHTNLTAATRCLEHQRFKQYGLVIIDADQPTLKKLFSPFNKTELLEQKSYALIQETSRQLSLKGYGAQATPREINLFYLRDGYRK